MTKNNVINAARSIELMDDVALRLDVLAVIAGDEFLEHVAADVRQTVTAMKAAIYIDDQIDAGNLPGSVEEVHVGMYPADERDSRWDHDHLIEPAIMSILVSGGFDEIAASRWRVILADLDLEIRAEAKR